MCNIKHIEYFMISSRNMEKVNMSVGVTSEANLDSMLSAVL